MLMLSMARGANTNGTNLTEADYLNTKGDLEATITS
jgi:hypothetical protein